VIIKPPHLIPDNCPSLDTIPSVQWRLEKGEDERGVGSKTLYCVWMAVRER
jgi:hypothetical protein